MIFPQRQFLPGRSCAWNLFYESINFTKIVCSLPNTFCGPPCESSFYLTAKGRKHTHLKWKMDAILSLNEVKNAGNVLRYSFKSSLHDNTRERQQSSKKCQAIWSQIMSALYYSRFSNSTVFDPLLHFGNRTQHNPIVVRRNPVEWISSTFALCDFVPLRWYANLAARFF